MNPSNTREALAAILCIQPTASATVQDLWLAIGEIRRIAAESIIASQDQPTTERRLKVLHHIAEYGTLLADCTPEEACSYRQFFDYDEDGIPVLNSLGELEIGYPSTA